MLAHRTKIISALFTVLFFLIGILSAAAAEPVNVIVKLQPGADPVQLSVDHHDPYPFW